MIENEDYLFIKKFFDIKITKMCNKLKIDRSRLISGKYKDISIYKKIRREIEKEVAKIYLGGK